MITAFITTGLLLHAIVGAGDLEPTAGPDDSGSAMYTIEDIYNYLDTGVAGAKRSSGFTEPTSEPGSTMHTLDEIMNKAPAPDNVNGAAPGEVFSGKTYWGLRTDGAWEPQTGTAAGTSSCTGDAAIGDVLSGKTFSNATSTGLSGTMTNVGQQNITPGATSQTITQGYHDGTSQVAGNADLLSGNIRSSVSIFGVAGHFSGSDKQAVICSFI
jgi:hypothetical protein